MNDTYHPEDDQLLAYHDEELATAEATLIKEHCEVCSLCRQTLTGFAAVQEMIQTNIPDQTPLPVWPAVARGRKDNLHQIITPSLVFSTIAACAAGIAIGFLLGAPQSGNTMTQGTETWSSVDYLWSSEDSPSLFTKFSTITSQERSEES